MFSGHPPESGLDGDKYRVLTLSLQGPSSLERYNDSGMTAEPEEGTNALGNADERPPGCHPMMVAYLDRLGDSFLSRFERLGGVVDLHNAITMKQHVAHLTPDDHP